MKRLSALVLLAACLRFANVYHAGAWADPLCDEPTEEVMLAQGLAAGRGYVTPFHDKDEVRTDPSAHSPPGYPYLLAGILRATRPVSADARLPYRLALALNVLVGSVAVGLLAVVGGRARGTAGFWCAGLAAACWPTLVRMSGILWDTPFSMLAVGLALVLVTAPAAVPLRFRGLLAVGAAWGVFTLFNPLLGPFLAVSLVVLSARGRGLSSKGAAVGLLAAFGVWALCLAPWEVRNARAFHRFVPIRHNFGLELWLGNLPGSDGTTMQVNRWHPRDDRTERRYLVALGDDAYMSWKSRQAIEQIRDDPGRFLARTRRRMVLYWFGDVSRPTALLGRTVPMPFGVNLLKVALNGLLLAGAALGILVWPSQPARWVCGAGILTFPLPYYVTHVAPNYRVFVDPLLCLLASVFVASAARALVRAWNRRQSDGLRLGLTG